jgi:hypothetical protein
MGNALPVIRKLVDDGDSVSITCRYTGGRAPTRAGVIRLIRFALKDVLARSGRFAASPPPASARGLAPWREGAQRQSPNKPIRIYPAHCTEGRDSNTASATTFSPSGSHSLVMIHCRGTGAAFAEQRSASANRPPAVAEAHFACW